MIEVSRFHVKGHLSVDEFLAANDRFQRDFAYQQKGLVRRTVARGADGAWLSLTVWRSMRHVEDASLAAETSPVALEFTDFIDPLASVTEYFDELPG